MPVNGGCGASYPQVDDGGANVRRVVSPDLTGTVQVVMPLLQLLSLREAVTVAEAVADRVPPTPARVRLLLAACARCVPNPTNLHREAWLGRLSMAKPSSCVSLNGYPASLQVTVALITVWMLCAV